jgi:type I restriction enzyme R subunit
MNTPPLAVSLFDPESAIWVVERRLPHWSQSGAITFITWRTEDSMPKEVLDQWFADRNRLLTSHGIDPTAPNWYAEVAKIDNAALRDALHRLWNRWHDALDVGHGACALQQHEHAKIVADSLRYFDEQRYIMLDFVVMPNHVHLLASFPNERAMLAQCESWKHFTAVQINRSLGRKGRFWQQDAFDHLVRSEEQFWYLRDYIANNPVKAGLRPGEFLHYSKALGIQRPFRGA